MNVTIKLADDLCRRARHRAVDENLSLSGWIARILKRELDIDDPEPAPSLLDTLGDPSFAEGELPLPDRRDAGQRSVEFP